MKTWYFSIQCSYMTEHVDFPRITICLLTAGKEMFGPSPVHSSLKDRLSSYRPELQIYSPNRFVIKTVFLNQLYT